MPDYNPAPAGDQFYVPESETAAPIYLPDPDAYNREAALQRAAARRYYQGVASGRMSAAEGMMREGMGHASNAAMAGAVGRGADPLAQRRALMGGAAMHGRALSGAAGARSQEMAQARGAQLDAANRLRQGEFGWAQQQARVEQARAQHAAQLQQLEAQEHAQDMALVGAAVGGAGSMAGSMASDERTKTAIRAMRAAAADAMARGLDYAY